MAGFAHKFSDNFTWKTRIIIFGLKFLINCYMLIVFFLLLLNIKQYYFSAKKGSFKRYMVRGATYEIHFSCSSKWVTFPIYSEVSFLILITILKKKFLGKFFFYVWIYINLIYTVSRFQESYLKRQTNFYIMFVLDLSWLKLNF